MREIKFRGKRRDGYGWVYGSLDSSDVVPRILRMEEIGEYGTRHPEKYEVLPSSVGEYTGLKDSDGNEIYEGDLIRAHELLFPHSIGVVRYFDSRTSFFIDAGDGDVNDLTCDDELHVVGNIYDNPDMIDGQ